MREHDGTIAILIFLIVVMLIMSILLPSVIERGGKWEWQVSSEQLSSYTTGESSKSMEAYETQREGSAERRRLTRSTL